MGRHEREVKFNIGLLEAELDDKQFITLMHIYRYYADDTDDIRVVRKVMKKLKEPTFKNIADKVSGRLGVVKLRRLLEVYEKVEWIGKNYQPHKAGRPTKIYERIKR